VLLLAVAAVVIAGGLTAALVPGGGSADANSHTASGPWRLMIQDSFDGHDPGCNVTLIDTQSGDTIRSLSGLYGKNMIFQIHQAGKFRWQVSNSSCLVMGLASPGNATLPLEFRGAADDTDAFTAPAKVAVHVDDYNGSPDCPVTLIDPATGETINAETATPGKNGDTVTLDTGGRKVAYLSDLDCQVRVTAAA
jgi:hypothetical protein